MAGLSPIMVTVAGAVVLVAALALAAGLRAVGTPARIQPGADLSFYQVAYLAGGARRVAETALAFLVWSGLVEIRERTGMLALRSLPPKGAQLKPVEAALVANLSLEGCRPALAIAAARHAASRMGEELEGLVVSSRDRGRIVAATLLPAGLVVTATLAWIASRLTAGLDLGLVPAVTLGGVAVGLASLVDQPRVSQAGHHALRRYRRRAEDWLEAASIGVTSLPVEEAMYVVALGGRRAMNGGLHPVRRVLGPG